MERAGGLGCRGNSGRCQQGWNTCQSCKDMDRSGGEQSGVVEVELQTLKAPTAALYYYRTL